MAPLLDDAPVVEHEDTVGALHRGEAVRDDDGRAPAHRRVESALDNALTLRRFQGIVQFNLSLLGPSNFT